MDAAWVLLTPSPTAAGAAMAIVADARHTRYLSATGETVDDLDHARTAGVARKLGLEPGTARAWLHVAQVEIGPWQCGPVTAAEDFQRAYEQAAAAVRNWTPGWQYRSQAERLAHEAELMDEWKQTYPEAAAGDVDDPDADLYLAQLMLPPVHPERHHRWMPFAVDDLPCGFCDQEADGPLHSTATPLAYIAGQFAPGLLAKARLLRTGLTGRQDARIRESMSDDIKKFCDVVTPDLRPPHVSRAALDVAAGRVDLHRQAWHAQPSFDPGRAVFHLEHVVPVRALREACLSATRQDHVVAVLDGIRLAWILKDEDRRLSQLGYRTRRERPDEAYRAAGIDLVAWYEHGAGAGAAA